MARARATLDHPGIAAIYEVGGTPGSVVDGSSSTNLASSGGSHYLVMEYLPGETLAERLARGDLATGDALQTARQLAGALEAAHEQGVVHRDLEPANIKIDSSGRDPLRGSRRPHRLRESGVRPPAARRW